MTVAGALRAVADDLAPAATVGLLRGARDAKARFTDVAKVATGGDGRLSRAGRSGARLSARYTVVDDAHVTVGAVGPWQLIEYPRAGGYPIPKGKGRGRNRRRKVPRFHVAGEWRSGQMTGGAIVRPTGPWRRAEGDVIEAAGETIVDEMLAAVDRAWR